MSEYQLLADTFSEIELAEAIGQPGAPVEQSLRIIGATACRLIAGTALNPFELDAILDRLDTEKVAGALALSSFLTRTDIAVRLSDIAERSEVLRLQAGLR